MARRTLLTFILLTGGLVCAQTTNTLITGYVYDEQGQPVQLVNIGVKDMPYGSYTKEDGSFSLQLPADNKQHKLVFSAIAYINRELTFSASSDTIVFNIIMQQAVTKLQDVTVREYRQREEPLLKNIPLKDIDLLPAAAGSLEKLLVSLPGVNSNNELSSQYRVRGGNYDENLVYVNDIEIYHPVLIKTGRQEGLSFLNPDLISNVRFSSGGFNASYGDRMSSVLDIRYRQAVENRATVKLGLLTSSAHIEGISKNKRFSYLAGTRYKTNQLLLQTMDTKGRYRPAFYDIQSLLRYRLTEKAGLSLMGSYSSNKYSFIPGSRKSTFGSISEAYQLYVLYQGSETNIYRSVNLALALDLETAAGTSHKFIAHYYNSAEEEKYDIRGSYSLNLLDKNLGSENFGDSIMNVGTGSWLSHARNLLGFNIYTLNYKGRWENRDNVLRWGLKYNNESNNDRIREWKKIDSAGYSIPYSDTGLILSEVVSNDTILSTRRAEAYLINNYSLDVSGHRFILSGGARLSYWSFSGELLFSPRLSLSWNLPSKNMRYYIAGGVYYQPPFYREMRYPTGRVNADIRSQKSVHTVVGTDFDFSLGVTPFRFTGEVYYKDLDNIIPYKYDNVRIIYSAENSAKGFVRGLDLRLNGEFVKDAESWISLSLMDARHDIQGDDYGYFPSPSDVRFSSNIFFQDYFPSNPGYRAHINIHFSTGIPVSSPYTDRYDNYHRMPSYRRVDIGFTRVFKNRDKPGGGKFLSLFREVIAGFEVFNLLDIRNTISYNWLTTVNNLSGESRQYAVPNYLTGRSFNIKLSCEF
ncbi:MAG: TonB-dependent receptor [Bacteroidales bacterium]|nr:TonB-dependent receptor [Bacteroidales bacterium]